MKLKHTPGPWKYEKGDEDSGYEGRHFVSWGETQCDETTICETHYGEWDARLIAHAPDMLEALIKTYKHNIACGRESEIIDLMKSIIESATGLSIEEVLK